MANAACPSSCASESALKPQSQWQPDHLIASNSPSKSSTRSAARILGLDVGVQSQNQTNTSKTAKIDEINPHCSNQTKATQKSNQNRPKQLKPQADCRDPRWRLMRIAQKCQRSQGLREGEVKTPRLFGTPKTRCSDSASDFCLPKICNSFGDPRIDLALNQLNTNYVQLGDFNLCLLRNVLEDRTGRLQVAFRGAHFKVTVSLVGCLRGEPAGVFEALAVLKRGIMNCTSAAGILKTSAKRKGKAGHQSFERSAPCLLLCCPTRWLQGRRVLHPGELFRPSKSYQFMSPIPLITRPTKAASQVSQVAWNSSFGPPDWMTGSL